MTFKPALPVNRLIGMFLLGLAAVALGLIAVDIIREAGKPVETIPYLTAKDPAPAVEVWDTANQLVRFDPAAPGIKVLTFAIKGHTAGRQHLDHVARAREAVTGADISYWLIVADRAKPEDASAAAQDVEQQPEESYPAGLTVYWDKNDKAIRAFGVRQVPMTFVIDHAGKIQQILGGGRANPSDHQAADEALAQILLSLRAAPAAPQGTETVQPEAQPPSASAPVALPTVQSPDKL